jgi:hypothetical protein
MDILLTEVKCWRCGSARSVVLLTPGGWQCMDLIDCLMRQPAEEEEQVSG